jgi:hypothetical protein
MKNQKKQIVVLDDTEVISLKDISKKIARIKSENLDEAIKHSQMLYLKEEERGDTIEAKANSLIGNISISTGLITGLAGLIVVNNQIFPFFIDIVLIAIYLVIGFSIIISVLWGIRTINVGEYKYTVPDIEDVYKFDILTKEKIKREQISTYIYCCLRQRNLFNTKANRLITSQKWFRVAIYSFVGLALALAVSTIFTIHGK